MRHRDRAHRRPQRAHRPGFLLRLPGSLLTERFSEIHLFDLRYNKTSLKSYIEEHNIDNVVVLYSFSNFVTDQNLFLLGQ